MSKSLKYGIIGFAIFLTFSIIVYCVVNIKENIQEIRENELIEADTGVTIDIEKVIKEGTWHDITEEDKITLAFSSETSIISTVKNYLKDNKIAIFFVYGGPFDYNLEGNYIICTGFNEDGKAKILYPDDNFSEEWKYSFEGLIEFATKVMLFEM
ncbi:MAG: hypothetical protein E7314_01155 [Clostridiales bacterium]|nr:hypothetical protein [Clostridiales bacterium]